MATTGAKTGLEASLEPVQHAGQTSGPPPDEPRAVPGFYVAHHPWLDAECGPDSLNKVGCSGDLRRRLHDSSYVTAFSDQWAYVYTAETEDADAARKLEAAVLHCAETLRLDGRELVKAPGRKLRALAEKCADALSIKVLHHRSRPLYVRPAPAGRSAGQQATGEARALLAPEDFAALAARNLAVEICRASLDVLALSDEEDADTEDVDAEDAYTEDVDTEDASMWEFLTADDTAVVAPGPVLPPMGECVASGAVAVAPSEDEEFEAADELDLGSPEGLDVAPGAESYALRDYQAEAMAACSAELRASGKAILQMTCRSGKTLVARHLLAPYLERGRRAVLFLVPGLPLLRQTAQKLDRYGGYPAGTRVLLVGTPRPAPALYNLAAVGPQTTDPAAIASALGGGATPLIVVSTYQSSPLVPLADDRQAPQFGLVVFDEAHRVCGSKRPRPFSHTLTSLAAEDDLAHQHATHRLAMTATPAYDSGWALNMKDEALFGGIAFRYYLRQGIEAGSVNRFRLMLVGGEARAGADARAVLLDQVKAASGLSPKLLVYCATIKDVVELARDLRRVDPDVWCDGVHSRLRGGEPTVKRILGRFRTPGVRAVLFNCRMLAEGVEIPELTGVMFAAPRKSTREIIQSLCRPLNVMPGKPESRVFIPVCHAGAAPEDAATSAPSDASLERLGHFAALVPVFDALMAEDRTLYEHLLDPVGAPYPLEWVNANGSRAGALALLNAARRAVRWRGPRLERDHLTAAKNIPWEVAMAELRYMTAECLRYPKGNDALILGDPDADSPLAIKFDSWMASVRTAYKNTKEGRRGGNRTTLEPYQVRDLEALPHWETYGVEGGWNLATAVDSLARVVEEAGALPPMPTSNGAFIGFKSTKYERACAVTTHLNMHDSKDSRKGPGSGFTVSEELCRRCDEIFGKAGLTWRKQRGADGAFARQNSSGEYTGPKTCVQLASIEFTRLQKAAESGDAEARRTIQETFPGFPDKHGHMEDPEVYARGAHPPSIKTLNNPGKWRTERANHAAYVEHVRARRAAHCAAVQAAGR
jgi:superfamily II DNA or RNA helicase